VSEVLDIAQLDSGHAGAVESTFALDELVQGKCRELAPLAEAKGLTLVAHTPPSPIWVRSDRMKLDRILANLVGNAIKFTAQGGVTVTASVNDDGTVLLEVADTGRGIAANALERIFEEFSQVDEVKRDPQRGWGLGLAICRRLAGALGGRIEATSEPGNGSVFRVELPASCRFEIGPVSLPSPSVVGQKQQ
jgi:signal transduction histidine kinase